MSSHPDTQDSLEPEHLQHAAEHEKPRNRNSVMGYLLILFAAAFLLLLLSYLMQQRNSAETISSLKESVSAMQSVQDMMEQNEKLEEQVAELEKQVSTLQEELEEVSTLKLGVESELRGSYMALDALDHLRYLEEAYQKGKRQTAKELIEAMEQAGLVFYLPDTTNITSEDVPSPAERFQTIYDALY